MVSNVADKQDINQDLHDRPVPDLDLTSGERSGQVNAQNYESVLGSSAAEVRQALVDLHQHLQDAGLPLEVCETAQIALGEVLNNIVEHAYGSATGHSIFLRVLMSDKGIWCETHDQGAPMPDGEPPTGAMPMVDPNSIMDLAEGGFGWAMVRELAQQISYQRQGKSNRLRFLIPAFAA